MPSASAVEGNVRYNENNDYLEIYYEGAWVACLPVGCQIIDLCNSSIAEWYLDDTGGGGASLVYNNDGSLSFANDNNGQGYNDMSYSSKYIDITTMNIININYKSTFASSYHETYNSVAVAVVDEAGTEHSRVYLSSTTRVSTSINITNLTGKCRIRVIVSSNAVKNIGTIYEFTISKA